MTSKQQTVGQHDGDSDVWKSLLYSVAEMNRKPTQTDPTNSTMRPNHTVALQQISWSKGRSRLHLCPFTTQTPVVSQASRAAH